MTIVATLRQQAKDLPSQTFNGSGAVRGLGAVQWFTLNDHPTHDTGSEADRQFTVLRHLFHARNNLPGDLSDVIQSPPNTGAMSFCLQRSSTKNQINLQHPAEPVKG